MIYKFDYKPINNVKIIMLTFEIVENMGPHRVLKYKFRNPDLSRFTRQKTIQADIGLQVL